MVDEEAIERVYDALPATPVSSRVLAETLRMNHEEVGFILGVLKKQGRAKSMQVSVRSHNGSTFLWVKKEKR